MADTTKDDELRDTLHGDIQSALGFADITEWGSQGQKDYEAMLDIVMKRITLYGDQRERDGRMDELKDVRSYNERNHDDAGLYHMANSRIRLLEDMETKQ